MHFPIDHHCKTQLEVTDMFKDSPNLLNSLQGVRWPSGLHRTTRVLLVTGSVRNH